VADAGSSGPPPPEPPPPPLPQPPSPRPEDRLEAKGKRTPWAPLQPTDAMLGLLFVFFGLLVAGGVVLSLISREPDQTLVALIPQGLIFIGVPLAIAARRVPSRPWRVIGYVPFRAFDLLWVLLALVVQIVATVLFVAIFFEPQQDTILEDVNFNETTLAAAATVFLVVIAAPITEETLFRGLFFGALRSRAPFWVAAGVSGVLFGAVHLGSGDVAVAGLLSLLGVILAGLYEKTRSLGPPILLHMVNNVVAIIPLLNG